MAVKIEGTCDPKFSRVKDAFAENFEKRSEVGAAAAVVLDGKSVVDIWGGYADKAATRPWTRDTLVNVYSTTKGVTAICAHRLVDKGLLDIDAPVAKYWPEFAQAGKDKLPVRFLLSHRAGLPAVRKILDGDALFNWTTMANALAEQEPWWEPGTAHGYHAVTFGWLVGEVIRRITGKTPGVYLRDEITGPLGLDFHIGLDAKDDARVGGLIPSPPPGPGEPNIFAEAMKNPESVVAKAFMNPPLMGKPGLVNSREWRAAEIPAANGHGTARSLARLYGALARGGELALVLGALRPTAARDARDDGEEHEHGGERRGERHGPIWAAPPPDAVGLATTGHACRVDVQDTLRPRRTSCGPKGGRAVLPPAGCPCRGPSRRSCARAS